MDKREKLTHIIKSAQLPQDLEKLLLEQVEKQKEITGEFILDVANTLDRIGEYFQNSAEIADFYLDGIIEEAQRASSVFEMLETIEEQLKKDRAVPPATSPRESLQMFTASAKPTK